MSNDVMRVISLLIAAGAYLCFAYQQRYGCGMNDSSESERACKAIYSFIFSARLPELVLCLKAVLSDLLLMCCSPRDPKSLSRSFPSLNNTISLPSLLHD
jgi:hypothetical protein